MPQWSGRGEGVGDWWTCAGYDVTWEDVEAERALVPPLRGLADCFVGVFAWAGERCSDLFTFGSMRLWP